MRWRGVRMNAPLPAHPVRRSDHRSGWRRSGGSAAGILLLRARGGHSSHILATAAAIGEQLVYGRHGDEGIGLSDGDVESAGGDQVQDAAQGCRDGLGIP